MKRLFTLLLVVVMATSLFAGCKTQDGTKPTDAEAENSFVVNLNAEPKTFDPTLNSANDGGHLINNMFEGLTADTSDGVVLAGAESYEVSEDGMTYTFKLRQDAKWSDGKPVTAHDYVYAWTRAMSAEVAAEYSYIVTPHIKGGQEFFDGAIPAEEVGVIAEDDYTLKVELNYPVPYFLALTAYVTYYPVREDVVAKSPENWFRDPAIFVGNGPFTLSEYQTGSHLILVPNKEYAGAADVKVDSIKCTFINEATTAYNAYVNGDIQVIDELIPTEEIPNLLASDPNFTNAARVGTYYYNFNVDDEILGDVRVRKALSYAIDRKSLSDNVLKGGEIPATGFVPGVLTDSEGNSYRTGGTEFGIDPTKAQIEEAKALLTEAGYPNGEGFPTLTLTYNTDERHKKIAETIQEMLKTNLGITVELINEEWAVFQDTRREGKYQIARGGWLGDYADPITMLDLFTSYSGLNDPQWRYNKQEALAPLDKKLNPEQEKYDQLIADSMVSKGTDRDALLKEADRYLIEENMIVMPVFYYSYNYLIDQEKVTGVGKTTMGFWIFKDAEVVID
ncbi:MAG: peptide ABC transporter substrate-binding protein [Firmicutes bacterium HGW-Firmicutes-7]|nr:MAG: peptide ABC transporter substrate-binding protein [Firmicutes bacterium HGW-Firmicutes-7]